MTPLTPEQLREIDAAVHVDVMCYEFRPDSEGRLRWFDADGNRCPVNADIPAYSTDIARAWSVMEKMQDYLPSLIWKCGDEPPFSQMRWVCDFRRDGRIGRPWIGAVADTAPIAISLAALKAVGKAYGEKA